MFKSVFAKYVTVLMAIITCGFALLLFIVTSIVGNYSAESKGRLMENAAEVTQISVEGLITDLSREDFSVWVTSDTGEEWLAQLLSTVTQQDESLSIAVADADGKILRSYEQTDDEGFYFASGVLPEQMLRAITDRSTFSDTVTSESSQKEYMIYAVDLQNAQGELCGIVAVAMSDAHWGATMADLTKTVISSALLVLLASMIAAYFITERTIAPLREMSTAARNFAAGNFDSRVIVRGKDEVAQLAEAFNQMAESLENLETMRNSFIANVSHDLRTPMTTIAGFIDGIRDGVIPPEERDHYLEVVSIEVRRLSRLVASLLDLSRIEAGDRKFTMKPFDICEMARLILISFEQKIEEKHLEVAFECDEDRMPVLADRDAIYQVFYNICHNAVKFSRDGGSLRICLIGTKDKKIRVSVYNDGDGIPKEDQPLVFERFYKSDKSRGLDRSGVGLGLFISKTIITAHGEKIWVSSEPGKNCEFFFTLQRASHNLLHTAEDK